MVTDYALTVEDVIYRSEKSEPVSTTAMLSYWGGTIGTETQAIADVRLPIVGERLLLFLRPGWDREVGFTPVVGLSQGLFSVTPDVATGRTLVREASGQLLGLTASGNVVRRRDGLADAPVVSIETFISWLRANMKSIKAAPSERSLAFDRNDPRIMKTVAKTPSLVTTSSSDRSIIAARSPLETRDAESSAGVPAPPSPSTEGLSGPDRTASEGDTITPDYVTLGIKPNLPIVVNNFPDSFTPWSPEDEYQMSKWNYYASEVFRVYTTPTSTYAWPDGVFDLDGFPSSADLQSVYGSGWDSNTIGVTFTRSSGSTMIEADIALNPAFGFTLDDEWIFNGAGNVQSFRLTMLHELGHMHGLDHNFNFLAVMNYFPSVYRFFGLPYMDDAQGIRAEYPANAVNRTDLGVYLYYETGYQSVSDATYPSSVVAGGTISPNNYHVENVGTNTISTPTIEWYLTTARNYNSSYYYLGQATYPSLAAFTYFTPSTVQRTFTVPTSVPPGFYYLGAFIRSDSGASQSGFPFSNNYAFSRTRIQVLASSIATITSPTNGSTFSSNSVTFTWNPGSGNSQYYLYVGNSVGSSEYFSNYVSGGSTTVSGLPCDGRNLYVRLWSQKTSGQWLYNDYNYKASSSCPTIATMTSPANGSTFTSTSVTFTWSLGSGNSQYYLYVGNTVGSSEYFSNYVSGGSTTVGGLPCDGRNIYVRLWSQKTSGQWLYNDYNYKASSSCPATIATMTSPANGSTFGSTSVTFTWSLGSGNSQYFLYVGNSPGSSEYFYSYVSGGSTTVGGLPADGRNVYVRLWSLTSSGWAYFDYSYKACACSGNQVPQITSPANGSKFGSSTVTFAWTAGIGGSQYFLYVGNSVGSSEYFYNYISGGSTTVGGLPSDGRTIYVRIWSLISGQWVYSDYSYRAVGGTSSSDQFDVGPPDQRPPLASLLLPWAFGGDNYSSSLKRFEP
jgi:hypothetical protein